jgi:hypothetical protein
MTEDEKIHCFITGLQAEVKFQVELQRQSDLQTAKEISDRADTIIFQAKEEAALAQILYLEIGQARMTRP